MIFLRPTIVRDAEDARALTATKFDYIRGQQLQVNRGGLTLDQLLEEVMGAESAGSDNR